MSRTSLSFLCFFMLLVATGQEPIEKPPVDHRQQSKWEYDAFSTPDFGTGDKHSYFSLGYKLDPALMAELQMFYDTYEAFNVIVTSIRAKWYMNKKLYFFSGLGAETYQGKGLVQPPSSKIMLINGTGYEVNNNILIEAPHDLNFNKSGFGNNATPSLFSLSGKYRF